MKGAVVLLALFYVFPTNIYADTIVLKNNKKFEGIISKETKEGVWLAIAKSGEVFFSHNQIKDIKKASPEQNMALEKKIEEMDVVAKASENSRIEEESLKKRCIIKRTSETFNV